MPGFSHCSAFCVILLAKFLSSFSFFLGGGGGGGLNQHVKHMGVQFYWLAGMH